MNPHSCTFVRVISHVPFRLFRVLAFALVGSHALGQATTATSASAAEVTKPANAPAAHGGYGPIEVLSDTKGVDFGPYLRVAVSSIKRNWFDVVPLDARAPLFKRGKVVLQFAIQKNGKVAGLHFVEGSGNVALDRAAYAGITLSDPFAPLPSEFGGDALTLRIHFFYNPRPGEAPEHTISGASTNSQEAVRISEILILVADPAPGSDGSAELTAAKLKAENLLAQIRSGKSFEEVAGKNPDVGFFQRGRLAKPIDEVVFAMKVGDVSDVIRTKQGYVILKVTDRRGQTATAPAIPPSTSISETPKTN